MDINPGRSVLVLVWYLTKKVYWYQYDHIGQTLDRIPKFLIIYWCYYEANNDVVPVARLEAFRALKLLKLERFRALKCFGHIGVF